MNRKILQAGPSTLAVSLPTSWVKKFNLRKSQELFVEEQGNCLKISTRNIIKGETANIDFSALDPISPKVIGELYRMGYQKIKAYYDPNKKINCRGKEFKQLDLVRDIFDQLTGMLLWEIGKKKNDYFAKAIMEAELEVKDFEKGLNRLFFNITNQAKQVLDIMDGADLFDEVYLNERLINQTSDFCIRILNTKGLEDPKKTGVYYDLISRLESIGDKYFHLCLYYKKRNEKVNKDILSILRQNLIFLEETTSLHRKFDVKKMINLSRNVLDKIVSFEDKINLKTWKQGIFVSYYTYSILLEIYDILDPINCINHESFREIT